MGTPPSSSSSASSSGPGASLALGRSPPQPATGWLSPRGALTAGESTGACNAGSVHITHSLLRPLFLNSETHNSRSLVPQPHTPDPPGPSFLLPSGSCWCSSPKNPQPPCPPPSYRSLRPCTWSCHRGDGYILGQYGSSPSHHLRDMLSPGRGHIGGGLIEVKGQTRCGYGRKG